MRQLKYLLLFAVTSLVIILAQLPGQSLAAETKTPTKSATPAAPTNITQAVTQSYNADPAVQLGMIVKLKDKDPTTVEPITDSTLTKLLGVVVAPNDSTVTIRPATAMKQQVFVASSGQYTTLVSSQNGAIKPGDFITASAIAGIGMKADEGQSIILGKAAGAFSGTANVIGKVALKNSIGKTTEVSLGRIMVVLDVSHNPLESKSTNYVPGFLARTAQSVADKKVSAARIYLGLAVLALTTVITANLVYSGVRNGMISIGRNPLSKKSIIKSLIQTVIAGLIIFIVGVLAVYLLLKL